MEGGEHAEQDAEREAEHGGRQRADAACSSSATAISPATGWPEKIEAPKLPPSARSSQLKYWM